MPRCNSPAASCKILPCSLPNKWQILSLLVSNNSLNLNITRARFKGGVLRHSGKAFCADAMASSTVSLEANATCVATAPSAGSKTS